MKNRFLSALCLKKSHSGGRDFSFFLLLFNFLLTKIYRSYEEKKIFSKNMEKKVPVSPFKSTQMVDRKQLFI